MPQELRFRNQVTLDISGSTTSSRKVTERLGRGFLLRELALRLSGSFTYAAAGNNVANTLNRGDEWGALADIRIVANGSDPIRQFSGHNLRQLNRLWYGSFPRMSATLADGTTAAPTFDSTLIVPFWQPNSSYPMDTILDTRQLGDLRIEVLTATQSDINSANGPTAISANVEVNSMESFGVDVKGTDWNVYPLVVTPTGANSRYEVEIPVTAMYRGFLINTANGAGPTAADLPNAITNVKLKSGTTVFFDVPWRTWQDWTRQRRGISRELIQTTAGAAAVGGGANGMHLNGARNTNLNEDAWFFLDLVQDGYMREALDSLGFSELKLEFNVAAACTITIFPQQMFPLRGR